jgi:hypothetical protein
MKKTKEEEAENSYRMGLIPNDAEKKILILVEEKKNLIQSFCHII